MIILNTITEDGPLVEIDQGTGYPVDNLVWNRDTPHLITRTDKRTTDELLWMADSHTGDYHDNMCSDMFMKWVKCKLIPTFETNFPSKKMVMVADNAPYHHKRAIGSL